MTYRAPARQRRLDHVAGTRRLPWRGGFDQPTADAPATRSKFVCSGWAWPFEKERVRSVELLVDDMEPVAARLTLRPDIAAALDLPEATLSGFEADVDAPLETASGDAFRLEARVHGLAGSVWTTVEEVMYRDGSMLATGDGSHFENAGVPGREARPAGHGNRSRERLRLGYDPWHTVVLVEGPDASTIAGPSVAALDAIAEDEPNMELLILGVQPMSELADLLRRSIAALGLEDRVTVPTPADDLLWQGVADFRLEASLCTDLADLIDALRACGRD